MRGVGGGPGQALGCGGQQIIAQHAGHKGSQGRQRLGDCLALPTARCQAGVDDAAQILHTITVPQAPLWWLSW